MLHTNLYITLHVQYLNIYIVVVILSYLIYIHILIDVTDPDKK